jgi:rare lipoprotein A
LSSWRRDIRAVIVLLLLSLAESCTTQSELPQEPVVNVAVAPTVPPPSLPTVPHTKAKASRDVRASYQGSAQAGQLTASGEPYDPDDLTAASRTLPFGSTVVVTNPMTGRSAKVRINDRGPYIRGRSLDLSKRAAEKIGMTETGVARVRVKRTDSKPETRKSLSASEGSSSTSIPNSAR